MDIDVELKVLNKKPEKKKNADQKKVDFTLYL